MVTEITSYDKFLEILNKFNISNNAYLSYEYYSILCKYYPPKKKFLCFVYQRDEQIMGILPLVKRKYDYVILGYRFSNYLGYICNSDDSVLVNEQITQYISLYHKNIVITFYDINNSEQVFNILHNNKYSKEIFLYRCPYCDVSQPFEVVFNRQITKSKKRSELKKFNRKLNELGKIQILNIDTKEKWERGKKYFPEIFKVHAERFANIYIPEELCLHKNKKYYTELFEKLVNSGKAYISIMTLDEKVISFVYSAVSDGIVMDWMPAFDPAFTKYNLGTVHLMHIIEYLCENPQYKQFDFSKGDGAYKDRWANGFTENFMFVKRYSSNIFPIIKQALIYIPFRVKGWLREKGILRNIKKFLGKQGSHKIKKETAEKIRIVNARSNNSNKFSYKQIYNCNVEDRKLILDKIYNGNMVSINNSTDGLEVQITVIEDNICF